MVVAFSVLDRLDREFVQAQHRGAVEPCAEQDVAGDAAAARAEDLRPLLKDRHEIWIRERMTDEQERPLSCQRLHPAPEGRQILGPTIGALRENAGIRPVRVAVEHEH